MGLNMSKHAYLYGHVTRGGGGSRFVYVTGMHKRPEDGMWLPTGGQIGNGHIRVSFLALGERCKQAIWVILPKRVPLRVW